MPSVPAAIASHPLVIRRDGATNENCCEFAECEGENEFLSALHFVHQPHGKTIPLHANRRESTQALERQKIRQSERIRVHDGLL